MNSAESHRKGEAWPFLSSAQRRESLTTWAQRCVPPKDTMQESKRTWTRHDFPSFTAQIKHYGMQGPVKPVTNKTSIYSLK